MSNTTHHMSDTVRNDHSDPKVEATSALEDAATATTDALRDAGRKASAALSDFGVAASQSGAKAREQVARHVEGQPMTSILVAASVGLIAGVLLARR